MNAQDIINESEEYARREEENLKIFFPELYRQRQTDYNLTKCLKDLN